ncbi:hypothetical protein UFOVP45_92 [uncultured Caudovirales phage]|uniref:Uncharacterized protein n=1 Tax=uncultured Caudovirales phage TaxID=2100421 RepID=A0A6J5KQ40_9CAUD|nr:hypothetical protein UFOVP45_92 [uncultured Caudovirales phage]
MTSFGEPQPTSYFGAPETTLDPQLFQGRALQSWVRKDILSLLYTFLENSYRHVDLWAHAWLAGSGVSYQWSAARQPGDLDCLIGINYVQFRKANPTYMGLSDTEISNQLNEELHDGLWPQTANWHNYELTFYAITSPDIRAIKPYAAYDLKYDEWTVNPDPKAEAPVNSQWEQVVQSDTKMAHQITTRFNQALQDIQVSHNDATRRNAEQRMHTAGQQGEALFNEIHQNRSQAFSATGQGYGDFHNYRWQAGKREGTIPALRKVREYIGNLRKTTEQATYGIELPDTATLIRRAALNRNN